MEAHSEIVSQMAHDLRTPLTSMKLQIELSKRILKKNGAGGISPSEIDKLIQNFELKTDQLIALIEKYLP
jgi:signal transduction histidine kinase